MESTLATPALKKSFMITLVAAAATKGVSTRGDGVACLAFFFFVFGRGA